MLTERQAWLRIAEAWDDAALIVFGDAVIFADYGLNEGICPCIGDLEAEGDISPTVATRMYRRIATAFPNLQEGEFAWPRGDTQSRAAFCREMAALCSKRTKAKAR